MLIDVGDVKEVLYLLSQVKQISMISRRFAKVSWHIYFALVFVIFILDSSQTFLGTIDYFTVILF